MGPLGSLIPHTHTHFNILTARQARLNATNLPNIFMACLAILSLTSSLYLPSQSVMELAVLAKWLLPEIMEFAAWALLMTAKSQVSGFRKGLNNNSNTNSDSNNSNSNNDGNDNRKCIKCCCDNSLTARPPHMHSKILHYVYAAYIL